MQNKLPKLCKVLCLIICHLLVTSLDKAVAQDNRGEKVLVLSSKVGETVSKDEKQKYRILTFVSSVGFDSAQFIEKIDSSIFLRTWTNGKEVLERESSRYQFVSTQQILEGTQPTPNFNAPISKKLAETVQTVNTRRAVGSNSANEKNTPVHVLHVIAGGLPNFVSLAYSAFAGYERVLIVGEKPWFNSLNIKASAGVIGNAGWDDADVMYSLGATYLTGQHEDHFEVNTGWAYRTGWSRVLPVLTLGARHDVAKHIIVRYGLGYPELIFAGFGVKF